MRSRNTAGRGEKTLTGRIADRAHQDSCIGRGLQVIARTDRPPPWPKAHRRAAAFRRERKILLIRCAAGAEHGLLHSGAVDLGIRETIVDISAGRTLEAARRSDAYTSAAMSARRRSISERQ
jgi:SpoVK/Ycf46/Vps4 family AAA+-type ATPase